MVNSKAAMVVFSLLLVSLQAVFAASTSTMPRISVQNAVTTIGVNDTVTVLAGNGTVSLMIDGDVVTAGASPLTFNLALLNSSHVKPGIYLLTAEDNSTKETQSVQITLLARNSSGVNTTTLMAGIVHAAASNSTATLQLENGKQSLPVGPAIAVVLVAIAAGIATASGSRYSRRRR